MSDSRRKIIISFTAVLSVGIIIGSLVFIIRQRRAVPPLQITGVTLTRDTDPRKQLPIGGVEVSATTAFGTIKTLSDKSGLFKLTLPPPPSGPQIATLSFSHTGFQPLEISEATGNQLYLAYMTALEQKAVSVSVSTKQSTLSNVRVRYSDKATVTNNTDSLVKILEAVNTANVPCDGQPPCSPDGRWKASIVTFTEHGGDHEFRHPRLACIAGPCPFTRIESQDLVSDGHDLRISVRNWSDTATFLLEAEVSQTIVTDVVRQSYPTKFGSSMNFILPATAQGPSIEADLNGQPIVFPLGPDLIVSWGVCSVTVSPDKTKVYRCDLKPGYRFQ